MRLTVGKKLYLGFGFLSLIILVMGIYTMVQFASVEKGAGQISDVWLEGIDKIRSVEVSVSDLRILELAHIVSDSKEKQELAEQIRESKKQIEQNLAEYEGFITSEKERQMFSELQTSWQKYNEINNRIISQNITLKENRDLIQQSIQAYSETDAKIHALLNYNHEGAAQEKQALKATFNSTRNLLLVVAFLSIFLSLGAAYTLNQTIVKPLQQLEARAKQLAAGNLTGAAITVKHQDEVGQLTNAFNTMQQNFRELIAQQISTADQVAHTATTLANQAEQTSTMSAENAATVEEMAARIEQVAQDTQNVYEISNNIGQGASQGTEAIQQLNQQIDLISTATERAKISIDSLSQTLLQVNQIVGIINTIADQTNLLALNAAIEAARAGEQGRGFSVVADEVKKLAEQSADATKQISQLIQQIQAESEAVVVTMDEGSKEVKVGVDVASKVGEMLTGILKQGQQLNERFKTIAHSSEQVAAGIQNVASTTEEQTAAMQEVSAATDTLKTMVKEMNELTNRFKA